MKLGSNKLESVDKFTLTPCTHGITKIVNVFSCMSDVLLNGKEVVSYFCPKIIPKTTAK